MPLQKAIDVTPEIAAQIEKITGASVEAASIVVFEAAAFSTKPLTKRGSIFDKATPETSMLFAMADALNNGTQSVPLQTLHQQNSELPIGKVFAASIAPQADGSTTLKAMFFIPASDTATIEKINLGVIDEVSVGVTSAHMNCSACGWDYMGDGATFDSLWTQTCGNGHVIGENGVHLTLSGLDRWMELSLVSRGASEQPKILSRAKALLSSEDYQRMAAAGTPAEAICLFISTPMETPEMSDNTEVMAQLVALAAQVSALTTSAAEAEALRIQLAAAQAELVESKAAEAVLIAAAAVQPPVVVLPIGGLAASTLATGSDAKLADQSIDKKTSVFKLTAQR